MTNQTMTMNCPFVLWMEHAMAPQSPKKLLVRGISTCLTPPPRVPRTMLPLLLATGGVPGTMLCESAACAEAPFRWPLPLPPPFCSWRAGGGPGGGILGLEGSGWLSFVGQGLRSETSNTHAARHMHTVLRCEQNNCCATSCFLPTASAPQTHTDTMCQWFLEPNRTLCCSSKGLIGPRNSCSHLQTLPLTPNGSTWTQ